MRFWAFLFFSLFILSNLEVLGQIVIPQNIQAEIHEYEKQIETYKKSGNLSAATEPMNKLAHIYWKHSYPEKAIKYYNQSLEINIQIENYNAVSHIHKNLAILNTEVSNYVNALKHFEKNKEYNKAKGKPEEVIKTLNNIANIFKNLKKYDKAASNIEEALRIAKDYSLKEAEGICYGELSSIYTAMGKKDLSELYYNKYRDFQKNLYDVSVEKARTEREKREKAELSRQLEELKLREKERELTEIKDTVENMTKREKELIENLSKKELATKVLTEQNKNKQLANEKLEQEKAQQNIFILFIIIVLIIVLISAVIIWKNAQKIKSINNTLSFKNVEISQKNEEIITQAENLKRAKEQIELKHTQITDSIEYARLIQTALLTPHLSIIDYITDSFLWYQPKDVVSGDFFWHAKLQDKFVIAAGDCTGHGVPGGFLTMIGYSLLGQIVQNKKITDPGNILTELNTEFTKALNQEVSENTDGMDISILIFDCNKQKLHFAGANSSVLLIENENLNILKPNFYSIGDISFAHFSKKFNKNFKTQTLDMPKNFSFYMHSDGVVDQFCKNDKERFLKKRLYEVLQKSDKLTAKEQLKVIKENFYEWKGNTKQTDDILMIGGKIKNYKLK